MKIVHCADFHFNRPLTCLDSEKIAAIRREEQLEAFCKTAELAKGADALLIAGDLFDSGLPDFTLASKIADCLKGVPRVFISPGNHDSAELYKKLSFPSNVHVFMGETESVDCGEFAVYGNCGSAIGDITLDESRINLLCLHADLDGSGDYNGITETALCSYGFDYAALGHIHKYSGIKKRGQTYFAYSGTPFAGGFDETGEKGVLVLDIKKSGTEGAFVPVDKRQFREVEIVLDNAEGYNDIPLPESIEGDFYKLVIKGTVSPDFVFRADVLREKVAHRYTYVRIKNETRAHIPYEAIAEEYSLKGIFVKKMLERIATDPDNDELKRALETGVRVLEGRKTEAVI